jgi:hypothetical protein
VSGAGGGREADHRPATPADGVRRGAGGPPAGRGREAAQWAAASVPGFLAGLAVLHALASWPLPLRLATAAVAMLAANAAGLALATAACEVRGEGAGQTAPAAQPPGDGAPTDRDGVRARNG